MFFIQNTVFIRVVVRPVTRGRRWAKPRRNFFAPWKNVLDIAQNYWT